jgi:hypothetical protein
LNCCFCDKEIPYGEVDPCALVLVPRWGTDDEVDQQFFCHIECFRDAGVNTGEIYVLDQENE